MDTASWDKAKKYAQDIGYIPIPFTTTIRLLITNQVQDGPKLKAVNRYQVARLLRSDSFRSIIYYATVASKSHEIEELEVISNGDLLRNFSCLDLAGLFGSAVLYRKARKVCPDDEWDNIRSFCNRRLEVGTYLGDALPNIGMGPFILTTLAPYVCLALFAKADAKKFKELRRVMSENDGKRVPEKEEELYGTNAVEVATLVLSALGYGRDISQGFNTGMAENLQFDHLSDMGKLFRLGRLWLECTLKGEDQPVVKVPGEYYPLSVARERLNERLKRMGEVLWLDREAADLSPEKTPKLFKEASTDNEEFEVPDELKDVFSLTDITSMEEEEFDELIDQIDKEQSGEVKIGSETFSSEDMSSVVTGMI